MITKEEITTISDIDVHTVRKEIKNIHLGVYPPNGRVRVAAPLKTTDEKIKLIVLSKMAWIKRHQAEFQKQERQTKREYVSGESHYFMGKRYLLNVSYANTKPKISIKRKTRIDMVIRPETTPEKREKLMNEFYRSALKKQIPTLLEKWEKITGIKVNEFRIKKMKTKWGSCTPEHKRIWINLELAKKPLHCLEYVPVHEMIHIIEKNHTEKFRSLLNKFMPNWLQYKEELKRGKLGYFTWDYTIT